MCLCVIVSTGTGYLLIEDEVQNCRVVSYTLQCVELCQRKPLNPTFLYITSVLPCTHTDICLPSNILMVMCVDNTY